MPDHSAPAIASVNISDFNYGATQKVVMEVDEISKSRSLCPPTLLDLPGELRNNIYRQLLRKDVPIKSDYDMFARSDDSDGGSWNLARGLDPNLLRVCHQLYKEGTAILYGENVFGIRITVEKGGEERAYFLRHNHFKDAANRLREQFKKIKKYEVTVEIQGEEDYQDTRIAVYTVCKTLQQVPGLALNISFDDYCGLKIIKAMSPVLEPFSSLRVREVQFGEVVESRFRNRIKSMMEGDSSPGNLHEKYREFLFFVDPCQSEEYSEKIMKAREAADLYDVPGFKLARDEVFNLLSKRMGRSSEHNLLSSVHRKRKVASSASA